MYIHIYKLGWTALHFAVDREHASIVELLLEANANPDLEKVIDTCDYKHEVQVNSIIRLL